MTNVVSLLRCSFYKGLPPLWLRQIPYTMMKFAAFERTVEFLYKHVVPVPRDQLGKPSQLVVTFAAGYIAGVFCAVVSHPADSVVSKLNSDVGSTPLQAAKDLGMRGESPSLLVLSLVNVLFMGLTRSPVIVSLRTCLLGDHRMISLLLTGLWKGLGARILMIGTLTALQWFIYDTVKVVFRLPRPPPPEMPESLKRKLQQKQQASQQ